MATAQRRDERLPDQGGPQPKDDGDGGVKSNTVSPSAGGGGLGKRPSGGGHHSAGGAPVPVKIGKFNSMALKKPTSISIKLGASKPKEAPPAVSVKKPASVFNDDDDDDSEPEEMPPEAKMRMKNIGRDTPTSAGPNSFNKGKHGFSDHQKLWEKKLKSQTDQ